MASSFFDYGSDSLDVPQAVALASGERRGGFSAASRDRIGAGREAVQTILREQQTVYGVNTGFGVLASTRIAPDDVRALQRKILESHSVGVGQAVEEKIVRLMLVTKLQALARGYSGVPVETLERIAWMLDEGILPVVPEKGSVGASGDLAPLAHLFLPLIGLGEVVHRGARRKTQDVYREYGVTPLVLQPKEGLALINGTQFMLAFAVKAVERLHYALEAADIIGAMSLEALTGTQAPFDERIHALRPFAGGRLVAQRLRLLLEGSAIMQSHVDCGRVQDPYSLRCMPQVHGASREAWLHLKRAAETELNAVTDNPLIFPGGDAVSGGNFHGQPIALPMDYACFAAAEIGNISDRRCYLLLEGKWGLPMLLMKDVGLNSGFMIPQYTTAALVSENKTLCFPASADSIPTSLGQEDHVSMGSISGRKLDMVLENLEHILAIELMTACQAIEFRRPLKSTRMLEAAHAFVRRFVGFAREDRIFADDIALIREQIRNFSFVRAVDAEAGSGRLNQNFEAFTL